MPNVHDTIKAAHDAVDTAGRALLAHHDGERYGVRYGHASYVYAGCDAASYYNSGLIVWSAVAGRAQISISSRRVALDVNLARVAEAATLADLHAAYTAAGNAWPFGEVA